MKTCFVDEQTREKLAENEGVQDSRVKLCHL